MQGGDAFVSVHTPIMSESRVLCGTFGLSWSPHPMECPMRRLPALSLLACLLLAACDRAAPAPTHTVADPTQAVLGASQRFAALRSFHAELEVLGAPQPVRSAGLRRARSFPVETPAGPQTIIGDTMFPGRRRDPPSADPARPARAMAQPAAADALPADLKAEDLGSQSLDGCRPGTTGCAVPSPANAWSTGWMPRACHARSYAAAAMAAASSCACAIRASTTLRCASICPE